MGYRPDEAPTFGGRDGTRAARLPDTLGPPIRSGVVRSIAAYLRGEQRAKLP